MGFTYLTLAVTILSATLFAQSGIRRPIEQSASGSWTEKGRMGSRDRKPLSDNLPAPEFPIERLREPRNHPPQAQAFDGVITEELSVSSEFQRRAEWTVSESPGIFAAGRPSRTDPRASLTSPSNNSTLARTQSFAWTAGVSASRYWLWVGSCPDCADFADRDMGLARSASVNLPADGRTIYATLFTEFEGGWYWFDYQFRAPSNESSATPANLTSPSPGSTLSTTQSFSWNTGSGVDLRWLNVGSCLYCGDIFDDSISDRSAISLPIPQDGRTIFVTVWSLIGSDWFTRDYQFRAPSQSASRTVRLNFTNQLRYAINLSVNDSSVGSVPAGETRFADVTIGATMVVSWDLVRPTLSGRALGDAMGGRYAPISNPSGTYNFTIDNIIGDSQFFRPLISNQTAVPLLIEVNGGLSSQNRCNCTAGAFTNNVHSGYYRLFSNSNVRVFRSNSNYSGPYRYWGTDSDGRVAPGGELWRLVPRGTGEITLTTNTAP